MTRDAERQERAQQGPIVGGLAELPGILTALYLTPNMGFHLRGLADELLVNDFPGATISRADREFIATAVSAGNDCFFCMDSHAAHASAILRRTGAADRVSLIETLKLGSSEGFDPKMRALLHIARTVGRNALDLTEADVVRAKDAGASDADVQLAVAIAAGFSMYNRFVDGFRARTPDAVEMYDPRAEEIAERGYGAPPVAAGAPSGRP